MEKISNPISFSLKRITTEQFAIVEGISINTKEIDIIVSLRFAVDPEPKIIVAYTLFKFECEGKVFMIIEAGCHFIVDEKAWNRFAIDKKVKIDKGFLSHIAMITVGTSRGILHAKTEGTPYNEFVLPTINVLEMIQEDIVFDLLQPV